MRLRQKYKTMRRRILAAICALVLAVGITGCNRSFFDTTFKFDEAYIYMPDGTVIHGEVDSWTDFEDGDQLQVTIAGVTYLTHATNVVLISH